MENRSPANERGSAERGAELLSAVAEAVGTVLLGKPEVIRLALAGILAGGHVLLEDVPGTGKTTLARALARVLGLQFRRVQFTNDLLPSDITGVSVFERSTAEFRFRPGPLFSQVVLADEINRATPRTQSALLEAMSEGQVSVDDETRPLPRPFLVLATQNPLEFHGTYPLPESQLDRFLLRLSIGHPPALLERRLLLERGPDDPLSTLRPLLDGDALLALQRQAASVKVDPSLAEWVVGLADATRRAPRLRFGVSTRGCLALVRAARALAFLKRRRFCLPDDLLELLEPVWAHRLSLRGAASELGAQRAEAGALLEELLSLSPPPV